MPVCNAHTISLFLMSVCIFNITNCQQSIRDQLKSNPFLTEPDDDDGYDLTRAQLKTNLFLNKKEESEHDQSITMRTTNRENAELRIVRKELKLNLFLQSNEDDEEPAPQPPLYITRRRGRPDKSQKPSIPVRHSSPQSLLSEYDNICGHTSPFVQGEQNIIQLIAHGDTVTCHYPWLVAIYRKKRRNRDFICGGTLISSKHMISAAHCFTNNSKDMYQFVVTNDLQKEGVVREAKEVLLHPDYHPKTSNADIALIVFSSEVPDDRNIRPICLWLEGRNDIQQFVWQ